MKLKALLFLAGGSAAIALHSAQAATTYTYDFSFSGVTHGTNLQGLDNWTHAGVSENRIKYTTDGGGEAKTSTSGSASRQLVNRVNDANWSFAVADTATTLVFEYSIRTSTGGTWDRITQVGIFAGSDKVFTIGHDTSSRWRIRTADANDYYAASGVTTTSEFWDIKLTVDLTGYAGEGSATFSADSGSGYADVVGLTNIDLQLKTAGVDTYSAWDTLQMDMRSGATVDDIMITAVPEPSTTALLGLGGLALILRRRK